MSLSTKRLSKELSLLKKEGIEGIDIIDTENILNWKAIIQGPNESPFEGGQYSVEIFFGNNYPLKPPSVKFISPIFHPNVYLDGRICVDILQGEWTPSQNVRSILLSLRSLLLDPNPFSPANRKAADLFKNNKELYNSEVRRMIIN